MQGMDVVTVQGASRREPVDCTDVQRHPVDQHVAATNIGSWTVELRDKNL